LVQSFDKKDRLKKSWIFIVVSSIKTIKFALFTTALKIRWTILSKSAKSIIVLGKPDKLWLTINAPFNLWSFANQQHKILINIMKYSTVWGLQLLSVTKTMIQSKHWRFWVRVQKSYRNLWRKKQHCLSMWRLTFKSWFKNFKWVNLNKLWRLSMIASLKLNKFINKPNFLFVVHARNTCLNKSRIAQLFGIRLKILWSKYIRMCYSTKERWRKKYINRYWNKSKPF